MKIATEREKLDNLLGILNKQRYEKNEEIQKFLMKKMEIARLNYVKKNGKKD